jgi:Tfp pilus assembly protein PilZ
MNERDYAFRRMYERKTYGVEIVFSDRRRGYAGTLQNISLGGAFVVTQSVNQFSPGDIVIVSIPFSSGNKHVKRQGRIKWVNEEGFAVEFI